MELPLEITIKTKDGKIMSHDINVELGYVPCQERWEECHGWHNFYDYDDNILEQKVQNFEDELTPEYVNENYGDYFDFEECVEIISVRY